MCVTSSKVWSPSSDCSDRLVLSFFFFFEFAIFEGKQSACVRALPCYSRPRFGCSGLGSCTLFQNKVHTCRILLQRMYIFTTYQNHKYHEYPPTIQCCTPYWACLISRL